MSDFPRTRARLLRQHGVHVVVGAGDCSAVYAEEAKLEPVSDDHAYTQEQLDSLGWEAFLQSGDSSLVCVNCDNDAPVLSEAYIYLRDDTNTSAGAAKVRVSRKNKVIRAIRNMVEQDPASVQVREYETRALAELIDAERIDGTASRRAQKAREEWRRLRALAEDFHLAHLSSIADLIERCGTGSVPACQSYWCPHCRKRFGARLLEDTQGQLNQRYGTDLEAAREQLLYATILNEIVIPDPEKNDYDGSFRASEVRRDHRDIKRFLDRWKADNFRLLSDLFNRHRVRFDLLQDWLASDDRDRRFYRQDNLLADAVRLTELNATILEARRVFRGKKRNLPNLESKDLISCRDQTRVEAFLYQLRHAEPLERNEIYLASSYLQCIDRDFPGITKTNFKERLKFKSSIEKIMKHERGKLYRLTKDFPNLSLIGTYELELINLRHAVGGSHRHTRKTATLRSLASQLRRRNQRVQYGDTSTNASIRDFDMETKVRLLDRARAQIANGGSLEESEFPGLQYAVLLHMHVVIDLNGHLREDVDRWLSGKEVGERRFVGQWKLPHQVMLPSLFANKSVDLNLKNISFCPFKDATTFNYEHKAPEQQSSDVPDGDLSQFSDEALAVIAWLQHGIGHQSLRVQINWPGLDQQRRGRKKPVSAPVLSEEEFTPLFDQRLSERGLQWPSDPQGETDLSELFEVGGGNDTAPSYDESQPQHASE